MAYPGVNRGAQTYIATEVQSRSPLELVVMAYDGAIRFLRETAEAMERRDLPTKARTLSRAMAILAELQNNLNLEAGGAVAERLDSLYTYMIARLLDANLRGDCSAITECLGLLDTLRSAWTELARQSSVAE